MFVISTKVEAWKCEKCGSYYLNKAATDDCCGDKPEEIKKTCRVCACEVDSHRVICHICLEQERFAKAEKVKYSEYEIGYLWDENKDEYFRDKEALEEKYLDDAEDVENEGAFPEIPTWCYGCTEIPFNVDIDGAIQSALEEMYEDFNEIQDEDGLRDFVKKWNAKQTGMTYESDYRTVILLGE